MPAFVQHGSTTTQWTSGTSGTSAPAFGSATGEGNCLVAAIGLEGETLSTLPSISSVTTNGSAENWTPAYYDPESFIVWYVNADTGGGQTIIDINVSFGGPSASTSFSICATVDIYEFSGLGPVVVVDQVVSDNDTSAGTSWSSGSTPPTLSANEVWLAGVGALPTAVNTTTTITPSGGGWTLESTLTSSYQQGGTGSTDKYDVAQRTAWQIPGVTGTPSFAGATGASCDWGASVITLSAPIATAPSPPPPLLIPPGPFSPMAFASAPPPPPPPVPAPVADYDTGTGTDSASPPPASLSGAEAGSGADAGTVSVAGADTGSGTETSSLAVPGADTGPGADAAVIGISDFDLGLGTDSASQTEGASGSDTGMGADSGQPPPATLPGADSGSGAEGAGVIGLAGSDAGSGAETGTPVIPGADAGSGADSGLLSSVLLAGADTGSGADAATVTALVPGADAGSGADAGGQDIKGTDAGTATESAAVTVRSVVLWAASGKLSLAGGVMG